MAETYSIEAILTARDAGFEAGMKAAQKSTQSLGAVLKKGIGFGAMMAIGNKAVSVVTSGLSEIVSGLNESSAAWKTFEGNMEMNNHLRKEIVSTKKELQKFAEQTIYSSSDMASTYAQLDAVGTKSTTKLVKGFGGLAAAAENPQQAMKTLSQQATQMAAKPKIQWEDFKLMVEQTPAGIAAVAKTMGRSTQQLIKDVQDGKVKTEDFFAAIAKTGTNKQFTKLATEYKTVGQAMDGLTETAANKLQPAFDKVSSIAIKGVSDVTNLLDDVDGNKIASKIGNFATKAGKYWSVFKTDAKEIGQAFGSAVSAIGKSMGELNGSFGSAKSVSGFKSIIGEITGGLKSFAGFCEDHSDAIASLITQLPKLLVAYKGFKIVKSVAPAVQTFGSAITKLAGKGIAAIAGKLFGIAVGEKAVGSASMESYRQTMQAAKAFMMLGVGVLTIAAGFGIMAGSAIALANSGGVAIGVMIGMVGALASIGLGLTAMLKSVSVAPAQLSATSVAFLAMGAAVVLVAAGLTIMAAASIALANAGTPAIACMAGMVVAVGALMAIAGAVGTAMIAGAVGFIAFGAAIVLVGAGALLAAASLAVVAGVLPTVVQYGTAGAVAIASLGASMIVFGAGAAVAGAGCIVLGAGLLAVGVGATTAGAGLLILGTSLTVTSTGFTAFGNVIKTVVGAISGGLRSVLDGISGVIKSVGESAKNAGTGFKSVAEGIKMISGLSIESIAKSLGAVAIGIGKISRKGSDIQQTANGMKTLSAASTSVNSSFGSMGAKATSALSGIKKSMSSTANAAKSSGKKMGSGFTSSMQSGFSKGPGIASKAVSSTNSRLRSGRSGAYSAGAYISQGFAQGMSSCLGQIEAAASRMVSAAEKAIRAKAQIHSPSRMTKKDGRYIAAGLAIGIRNGISSVKSASKTLAKTAINTMKKATKSRKYEDAASNAIDKYKTSMNNKVSSITKSLNNKINAGIKKLKKQHPKLKKAYTKVGKILKSDMSKTIKKQGQKAINAADKALTALGKKYQEKYDAIVADRDSYKSKLVDYGDLFSSDSYGFISIVDFKAQKKQVEQLAKNMGRLKKVLPYDLMKDIQNLDTAQGLKYTTELLKKSDAWLTQYGKDYTAFMNTANSSAEAYYKPYIDQIDKDYNSAVTSELNKLKTKMNTIAKEATAGFVKGLTSKSNKKALNKAAKDLANILTRAVKGKLKIHSPSRVLKALGVFVVKGFVNGISSMGNTLDKTMNNIITIPNFDNLAIAGDVGGSLSSDYDYYAQAEYTIVVPVDLDGKEVARVTAPYTEAELSKRQTRQNRKLGRL
jgi:tape measure domain-containing protein|nr:MAG TPA: tail tape measure [Caudoviricetes sp.]